MDRQTDRHIDGQTDRWKDRWTDRQMNKVRPDAAQVLLFDQHNLQTYAQQITMLTLQ